MRTDATQLRLASGKDEAYQVLRASNQMQWAARVELQQLQKGQHRDISAVMPEDEEVPWTTTPWDVESEESQKRAFEEENIPRRIRTKTHREISQSCSVAVSSCPEEEGTCEPDWSSEDTGLEIPKTSTAFVTSTARRLAQQEIKNYVVNDKAATV